MILCFFYDLSFFVGDKRPMARVETISIDGKKLDILVIEKSHDTPFRLSRKFEDNGKMINPNNVYTRV